MTVIFSVHLLPLNGVLCFLFYKSNTFKNICNIINSTFLTNCKDVGSLK